MLTADDPGGSVNYGHKRKLPDDGKPKQIQCYDCKGNHYADQCTRFHAITPSERWKIVKDQRACFSCWKRSKGHTSLTVHAERNAERKDLMEPRVKEIITSSFTRQKVQTSHT